jgi:hypothetical protein
VGIGTDHHETWNGVVLKDNLMDDTGSWLPEPDSVLRKDGKEEKRRTKKKRKKRKGKRKGKKANVRYPVPQPLRLCSLTLAQEEARKS